MNQYATPIPRLSRVELLSSNQLPDLLKNANTPKPATNAAPAATVLQAEAHADSV